MQHQIMLYCWLKYKCAVYLETGRHHLIGFRWKTYDRKWIWILLQLCEELNWHDEHWICGIDMQNICILFNMNVNSMLAWQDLKPCPRQDKSIVN